MLQAMKDKLSGWITWIIVTIISLIFVFWGMQAHFAPTAPQAEAVVKIGDRVVTKQDVTNRVNQLRTQLEDQDLSENELRQRAVQSLVRQKVLVEGTKRLKAGISDKQAEQLIYDMPVFKTNGQFSMEKYQRLIKQSRIQTATLRKQMADQLMLRQIRFGLTNSIMVLPWEKKHFARLLTQTRQIRYAYIQTRPYRSEVDVQKSEMKNHYQSHKADYVRAPKVKLNYIKLDMDQLENRINLTQEDLLAHYKANKSGYTQPEKRKAAQILIELPDKPSEKAIKKAEAKANKIRKKLKQGASFSQLASEYSDAALSKQKGGNVGWVLLPSDPNQFEKALYNIPKKGDIAGPVRTKRGYQIIKLTKIKPKSVKPFKKVKSKIKAKLKRQKAQVLFSSLSNKMGRLAFENPKSLKVPAARLDLPVKKTDFFTQKGRDKGLAQYEKVVEAAFSQNILKAENNSDPINIASGEKVVIHLNEYQPEKTKPFNKVKDQIRQTIKTRKAQAKAYDTAQKIQKRLNQGQKVEQLMKRHDLEWSSRNINRNTSTFSQNIVNDLFASPVSGGEFDRHYQVVKPSKDKVMLFAVQKVNEPPADKIKQNERIADMMLQNMKKVMVSNAYYQSLKNKLGIEYENPSYRPE